MDDFLHDDEGHGIGIDAERPLLLNHEDDFGGEEEDEEDDFELDENASKLSQESNKKRKPFPAVFFALGILFILVGGFAPSQLDHAVDESVWQQMRMDSEDTPAYKRFISDDPQGDDDEMYLKFRLFDIVNAFTKRPHDKYEVVERGPYVYKLQIMHINVSFFGEDTGDFERSKQKEVLYKPFQRVTHIVGGEHGGRDDSELITQSSMPYQAVMAIAKSLPSSSLRELILDTFLGKTERLRAEKRFVKRPVRDFLFGYVEDFKTEQRQDETQLSMDNESKSEVIRIMKHAFDTQVVSQNFGKWDILLNNNKGSSHSHRVPPFAIQFPGFVQNLSSAVEVDRNLEFDAQRVDRAMMHTFSMYQGSHEFRRCPKPDCKLLWGSLEANRVGGSDGNYWGGKHVTERLVFLSPLVRTAKIISSKRERRRPEPRKRLLSAVDDNEDNDMFDPEDKEISTVDGIVCTRWRLEPSVFSNVTYYPSNAAYYAVDQPDGVLGLGRLMLDIPLYASKPRYLDGDSVLRRMVQGIPEPSKDHHDVTFDIHDETGISVLVLERFQYSLRFEPSLFIPIFWFETIQKMSSKHAKVFQRCDSFVEGAKIVNIVGTTLGVLCIVASITIGTNREERDARTQMKKSVIEHQARMLRRRRRNALVEEEDLEAKQGFALILSRKALRERLISTPLFVFFTNMAIEILQLKKSRYVGVWHSYASGELSAVSQICITVLLNSIFVTINGASIARNAFIRGEVPRKRIPFAPFHRKALWALPWLFTDHTCTMSILVGFYNTILIAGPCVLCIYLFACGSSYAVGSCTWYWWYFILSKAFLAACVASVTYPMAALRTLDSDVYS